MTFAEKDDFCDVEDRGPGGEEQDYEFVARGVVGVVSVCGGYWLGGGKEGMGERGERERGGLHGKSIPCRDTGDEDRDQEDRYC